MSTARSYSSEKPRVLEVSPHMALIKYLVKAHYFFIVHEGQSVAKHCLLVKRSAVDEKAT